MSEHRYIIRVPARNPRVAVYTERKRAVFIRIRKWSKDRTQTTLPVS